MANILPSSRPSIPATSISQDPPRNRAGKLVRKRVKTGCLTCRKRRIKCGEQVSLHSKSRPSTSSWLTFRLET